MKVFLLIYGMVLGGAERQALILAEYLASHGDSVSIVTLDNSRAFYHPDSSISIVDLQTAHNSKNAIEAVVNNYQTIVKLRNYIRKYQPDTVICFAPNTQLLTWLAQTGCHHSMIGAIRNNPFASQTDFWMRSKRWISTLCNGFMFQTEGARRFFPRSVRNKSIILKNALLPEKFAAVEREWDQRENICAVGRLDAGKCFDDMLRAFAVVHEKHPTVKLNLYGDGPERGALERLSAELGVENVVTFHGKCQTVIEEYAKHKLFVMSSRSEGMPNVLLEAMASGCACVSTDCDFGPSELIRDGENGFLVPVHDVQAVADKICWLIEHDDEARTMGERAKAVRETHSVEQVGAEFRAYLKKLL